MFLLNLLAAFILEHVNYTSAPTQANHCRLWKAILDKCINLPSCRTVFYCADSSPEKQIICSIGKIFLKMSFSNLCGARFSASSRRVSLVNYSKGREIKMNPRHCWYAVRQVESLWDAPYFKNSIQRGDFILCSLTNLAWQHITQCLWQHQGLENGIATIRHRVMF